MSAACFETSEPAMPIATPMSAFLRAGESLTPSPSETILSKIVGKQNVDTSTLQFFYAQQHFQKQVWKFLYNFVFKCHLFKSYENFSFKL